MIDRYLQFANIEERRSIVAWCSACNRRFVAEPDPGKKTDDLLLEVRADFEMHTCPGKIPLVEN